MKKNVDEKTADLYNATKAAYMREFSGIIRNNGKCQPVTVDMMAQLANGRSVDGLALADGTDLKKVIELMPGYSCGLASLPRIYKQVARLAGETCEKITISGDILNAYGLTDKQLNAKENKKIIAVLKKFCPAPKKNDIREMHPFTMGLYHDSRRRCAVWTNAHIIIIAPWLYNDAAAGHIVAADGTKITDYEGQPAKYPDWSKAVPDMSYKTAKEKKFNVYSVPAAAVASNAASVAATVKGVKKAKEHFIAARYYSDGGIVAYAHTFAPWFSLVDGNLYFKNAHTAAVGYIHTAAANGFILFMPIMVKDDEISQYSDNKTIYADTENDIYIKNQLPQAAADSLPLPFLAVCPEVSTPAEPVTDAAADVVAEPAAGHCVALAVVPVADAEPAPAPVADAAAVVFTDSMDDAIEARTSEAVTMPAWAVDGVRCVYDSRDDGKLTGTAAHFHWSAVGHCWLCDFTSGHASIIGALVERMTPAPVEDIEAAVVAHFEDLAANAPADDPAATVTDADVLAQAARIKAIYDDLQAEADRQPAGMSCDDLPDTTPIYTAADVEKMIEAATADTYTAEEVAAMVAAAVAEERARHTRRRFAPRLRPVLRRLGRVAAVVLPLLIVALFMGASNASTPAADAAEVVAVVELQPVTVTATAPLPKSAADLCPEMPPTFGQESPAPSPVKKLAAPSPVKNVAEAAESSSEKTDAADCPAGEKTASPMATATDAAGLTICEGTPWAYTMMNWA